MSTVTRIIQRKADTGRQESLLKAAREYASQQIKDPFEELYSIAGQKGDAHLNALPPPYPPVALAKVPNQNNVLLQCIQAMVTNCELFGHTLIFQGEDSEKKNPEALTEEQRIKNLLDMPDGKQSLRAIRRKLRVDLEHLGYWFMEVGRDQADEVAWFTHMPADTVRICSLDPELVAVTRWVKRGEDDWLPIEVEEQFRRYVQIAGTRRRYFKEFGDPRVISAKTGLVEAKEGEIPEDEIATEVIHHGLYSPGDVYGKPRWINNMLSALGSREAELVNLQFFRDNAIPALAILVSGGELTAETMESLNGHFAETGKDMINRVLIIEAKGNPDDAGGLDSAPPSPSLSLQPLAGDRQDDALFASYDEANQQKLRSSFRLPPIFIGRSEDYTRATAEASLQMGENQVFGPERQDFDDIINTKLLLVDGKPPKFWKMRSNVAKLSDPEGIMNALNTLNSIGAVSTNMGIQQFNDLFGMNIPKIEDDWADLPFAIVTRMVDAQTLQLSQEAKGAIDKLAKFINGTESTSANAVTNGTVKATELFSPKKAKAKTPIRQKVQVTRRR